MKKYLLISLLPFCVACTSTSTVVKDIDVSHADEYCNALHRSKSSYRKCLNQKWQELKGTNQKLLNDTIESVVDIIKEK